MAWSPRSDANSNIRMAVGSFIENYNNKLQVIRQDGPSFVTFAEVDHPYPCTKLLWNPDTSTGPTDLLATTGGLNIVVAHDLCYGLLFTTFSSTIVQISTARTEKIDLLTYPTRREWP